MHSRLATATDQEARDLSVSRLMCAPVCCSVRVCCSVSLKKKKNNAGILVRRHAAGAVVAFSIVYAHVRRAPCRSTLLSADTSSGCMRIVSVAHSAYSTVCPYVVHVLSIQVTCMVCALMAPTGMPHGPASLLIFL